jgi:hypothetical protein
MDNLNCKIIGIEWDYIAEIEKASWPIVDLDFNKSNSQIIQMRNGMGKTTTTLLLRHLFSGVLPTFDHHKSIFERSVYSGGKKSPLGKEFKGEGQISVKLEINGNIWVIGLKLDYENKISEYFHVHPTEGHRDGWDAPQNFKNLFQDNEEFTELFLIDTQEAGSRQTSLNAQIIDGSIKGVTPLRDLENLISDLEDTYSKKIKKLGSDPGKEKLKKYQKSVEKIESLIAKNEIIKKKLTSERNDHKTKSSNAQKKLDNLVKKSKIKDLLEKERVKLAKQEQKQYSSVKALRESYLNPSNLNKDIWKGIIEIFKCLDELKLPEAVTKHVVETIRSKGECICGEKIISGSGMEKHLIAFEKDCIDSDVQEEAITIKRTIIQSKSENGAHKLFNLLKEENSAVKLIETEIKRLKGLLPADLENEITKLENKVTLHNGKVVEMDGDLKALISTDISLIEANNWAGKAILKGGNPSSEASDYENCKNITTLKKGLKHFTKLRDSIEDIHHYNQANNQIISLIKKTITETLQSLRETVQSSANEHFKPFQSHQMEISSLDNGVKFEDNSGNKKSGANTGAELAAQYSILLALTEIANVKIPLLIDNPVKGFDGGASEYFDENMASKVNQLLLVIISGPQERAAIPTIVSNSDSLSTLCRENELVSGKDPGGKPPSGNVIVKNDREWFMNYNPPKVKKGVK